MDLLDIAKAKAMYGGGSGGGGGDFTTAQVVLDTEDEQMMALDIALLVDNYLAPWFEPTKGTYETALYKGVGCAYYTGSGTVTVSGSASYDSESGVITMTGDCTITIS